MQNLEQGNLLYEKGDMENARVQYKNAVQLDPALSEAYFQLALIDEQKKSWPSMMGNLLQTVSTDPKHLEGQIKLGQVYLSADQLDKAAEQAKIALQLAPDNFAAQLLAAAIHFRKGENIKALQGIADVLEKQPFLADAIGMQATVLAKEKRAEEAVEVLKAGVEANPDDRELLLLKIHLAIETKKIDEAVSDYVTLIELHPNDVGLLISYADLLVDTGKLEVAESILREAIEKYPKESAPKLKLVALAKRRNIEQAKKLLADYIAEAPKDVPLKMHLAEIALSQKDTAKAERLTGEVLNLDKNHSGALLLQAGMKINSKNADGAIADLRIVLRDQPDSEQAMILMAMASALKGEERVAESQWRKVLEINPNNMTALLSIAKELLKRDDYVQAEEITAKAVLMNPNDVAPVELLIQLKIARKDWEGVQAVMEQLKKMPQGASVAKYWQGVIAALQGRREEAMSIYQGVLAIQPDNLQALMNLSRLYRAMGDRAGLVAYLKELTVKNPELGTVKELLISSYIAEKNWTEAEKALRSACDNDPDNVGLKIKLVNVIEPQNASRAEAVLKQFIQAQPNQVGLKFRLAGHYADHKRYSEATALLKGVVSSGSSDKEGLSARLKLSELAWNQKDYAGAKALLDEVINMDSSYNEALMMRASINMAKRDANAAIIDLNRVLVNQPDFKQALMMMAKVHQVQGSMDKAEESWQKLLKIQPGNFVALQPLIARLFQRKDWVQAEKLIAKALRARPGNPQIVELQIQTRLAKKDWSGAQQAIASLKNMPKSQVSSGMWSARLAVKQRQYGKAIKLYKKILNKNPDDSGALSALAITYASNKNWIEAEKILKNKLIRMPEDIQSYILLARLYAAQGKDKEAEELYISGLTALGDNQSLMLERAKFYLLKRNFAKSIEAYEEVVKKFPESDEATNNLAELLVTYQADDKQSIAHAVLLVERFKNSTNATVLDTFGWVHLKAGNLTVALPALKKAVKYAPQGAVLRYHLGEAFQLQGDIGKAIGELEKSLDLARENGEFLAIERAKILLKQLKSN